MVEKQTGTGQLRKLAFNKFFSDTEGVKWKLSGWKVALWMIISIIIMVIAFSFFQENQSAFLSDMLFYSIITMILILIIWVIANFVLKARKVFYHFLIGWILILGVYMGLGALCQAIGIYPNGFHYGFATWILISTLALGAKNIDQNLDKRDVFFAMLVIIIIFIANAPIFPGDIGFLGQVDNFLGWIAEKLSLINLQDLMAE